MPSSDIRTYVLGLTDDQADTLVGVIEYLVSDFGKSMFENEVLVLEAVGYQIKHQVPGDPSWAQDADAVPDGPDVVDYVARLKEITG